MASPGNRQSALGNRWLGGLPVFLLPIAYCRI